MIASPLKLLIVDEAPLVRESFPRLVAGLGEVEALEADTLAEAAACIHAHADLTLVVLDVALSGASGADPVTALAGLRRELPVIVFTARDDAATVRAALAAGARGLVSKRTPTAVIAEVVRLVLAGQTYVPPEALRASSAPAARGEGLRDPDAGGYTESLKLTPRQLDVLALLLQGMPNKLICRRLEMQEGTVKTHIAAIFRTLNVRNRTEVAYAVSQRGIRLPEFAQRSVASERRARALSLSRVPWLDAIRSGPVLALAD